MNKNIIKCIINVPCFCWVSPHPLSPWKTSSWGTPSEITWPGVSKLEHFSWGAIVELSSEIPVCQIKKSFNNHVSLRRIQWIQWIIVIIVNYHYHVSPFIDIIIIIIIIQLSFSWWGHGNSHPQIRIDFFGSLWNIQARKGRKISWIWCYRCLASKENSQAFVHPEILNGRPLFFQDYLGFFPVGGVPMLVSHYHSAVADVG